MAFDEIERKYLIKVRPHPDVLYEDLVYSVQGYLVVRPKWEWRIRMMLRLTGEPVWRTAIKIGNGFVRKEYEITLPWFIGRPLLNLVREPIHKVRFSSQGWEIDLFQQPERLAGLALGECEIPHVDHPLPDPPSYIEILEEVTEHGGYANKNLFLNGRPA